MSTFVSDRRRTGAASVLGRVNTFFAVIPGLLLTSAIAAAAFALRLMPGASVLSPLILSILIGMTVHNMIGTPVIAKPGISFSLRRVLRFAIILLGLQLTAAQVAEVGATGLAIIVASLVTTFVFTKWFGRLLGVERKLAELIAAGTSICGASAIIATNTVTEAPDEDVAYAVACVTVFGSVAMFAYPLLPGVLHLSQHSFGLWAGSSIHEIAQVVAAAYQDGPRAGDFATIAKLSRVMMLAPVVIILGFVARRAAIGKSSAGGRRVPLPWFVLGFVALVGFNSIVVVPPHLKSLIVSANTFLLSLALAAMGLETDLAKLRLKGLRPFFLGSAAFLFIAAFSLMLVSLTT
ncbi:MAG TPA: YeiH family protein [Pseudolabrys sp.]|nr:YeiH family protein [Pseudolabrys sp.]